jgi:uncharacterized protein YecE (DUF72 family)
MNKFYVGTSGFQYKGWAKHFYPSDVPQKDWLEFYSQQFNTVEINNTFYQLPSSKVFASWAEQVPGDFVFAIKGSRYITHLKRLKEPEPHIELFFDRVAALQSKLGAVLWQLPANLKFDSKIAQRFMAGLRIDGLGAKTRQALEVRHQSWFCNEAYGLLRQHNIALVIAHSQRWPHIDNVTTADHLYIRFHGAPQLYVSNYPDQELNDWANKIRRLAGSRDILAYFNNDANVHAPDNAQTFSQLLTSQNLAGKKLANTRKP